MVFHTTLTRRHTKETLYNPDTYTIPKPYTDFDFLDDTNRCYEITIRVVRFRLPDGSYQCVVPNLDADEFPSEKIMMIHHARWGEETSFREMVATHAADIKPKNSGIKHVYKINFAITVNICRVCFRHSGDENDYMHLICNLPFYGAKG